VIQKFVIIVRGRRPERSEGPYAPRRTMASPRHPRASSLRSGWQPTSNPTLVCRRQPPWGRYGVPVFCCTHATDPARDSPAVEDRPRPHTRRCASFGPWTPTGSNRCLRRKLFNTNRLERA